MVAGKASFSYKTFLKISHFTNSKNVCASVIQMENLSQYNWLFCVNDYAVAHGW